MISYLSINIVYNGKYVFVLVLSLFLAFFIAMDVHLYFALQSTTLIGQEKAVGYFSPFHPLTMKLLMTDPVNHYILTPLAENFDVATKFSEVFYFITPNMITFTHLAISFVSAKFVSSESLTYRRIAVILFQLRNWLDDLDGVVYRSHSKTKGEYRSNKNTLGYYVDIYSDIIGGVLFCFGILFYLWKCPPAAPKNYSPLPLTKSAEAEAPLPDSPSRKVSMIWRFFPGSDRPNGAITKKYMFWKTFCFGMTVLFASGTWDKVVERYAAMFGKEFTDPALTGVQTEALHSFSMWTIIYLWRLWEGQALIQMVLIAVYIDRVWEFLNFIQYLGFISVIVLNVISEIHLRHVASALNM